MKLYASLIFILFMTSAFWGCSTHSATDAVNNEFDDADYYISREEEKLSSSLYHYYNDYDYSSSSRNVYSSSSSLKTTTTTTSIYTTDATKLSITLTDYYQLKKMDASSTTDGDPIIQFLVKSYIDDTRVDSIVTSKITLGTNVGSWSGSITRTVSLTRGIDWVSIDPIFVDEDPLFNDKEYDSGYYYNIMNVGTLIGQTIYQSDYMATYFELEWKVVISY